MAVFASCEKWAGMISETLSVGLEKYQIGPKLRRLRLRKKLGLTELGRHTGLSAGMLSKIERGLLFPTLPTLLRIAIVFNTGLEHFFTDEDAGPQAAVIRKRQRLETPNAPGGKPPAYFFESLDFPIMESKIAAFYAEFTSDCLVSAPHAHEGAELIYQLRGKLRSQSATSRQCCRQETQCTSTRARPTAMPNTAVGPVLPSSSSRPSYFDTHPGWSSLLELSRIWLARRHSAGLFLRLAVPPLPR